MAVQKKVQKSTTKKKKRKNRKKRYDLSRVWMALGTLTVILLVIFGVAQHQKTQNAAQQMSGLSAIDGSRPDLDVELLTVNPYSRPGTALTQVNGIVIHYTANPGATAIANRNYFENLKDTHTTKASAHFIVGLEVKSCSAYRRRRLPMLLMTETVIPCLLNVVTKRMTDPLTGRPMSP